MSKAKPETTYTIVEFKRIGGKVEFTPAGTRLLPVCFLQSAISVAERRMDKLALEAVGVTTNTRKFAYLNIRKTGRADAIHAARLATQDAYNKLFKARNPAPGSNTSKDDRQKNIQKAQENLAAQEAVLAKMEGRTE